jgi:hypothetical protein
MELSALDLKKMVLVLVSGMTGVVLAGPNGVDCEIVHRVSVSVPVPIRDREAILNFEFYRLPRLAFIICLVSVTYLLRPN